MEVEILLVNIQNKLENAKRPLQILSFNNSPLHNSTPNRMVFPTLFNNFLISGGD